MGQNRIAGTCYIKVDGEQLELSGGVEIPMAATKKERKSSSTGVVGYAETVQEPYIKGTFYVPSDFPREKLEQSDNMTITVELANGKVYTQSESWVEGEMVMKSEEGTVDIEFSGKKGIWQ